MKQFKILYWNEKLGHRSVIIEAESEENANRDFIDLILNGNQIGYCKTEELTA
jgi:hypothetical protein